MDCEATFPSDTSVSDHERKNKCLIMKVMTIISDPKTNYKINFFYTIIDIAISKVEERFEQIKNFNDLFGFLNNIKEFSKKDKDFRLETGMNL